VTRVGVLGPGTIDIIELPGQEPLQRPGGTTLYAARALRFAGCDITPSERRQTLNGAAER